MRARSCLSFSAALLLLTLSAAASAQTELARKIEGRLMAAAKKIQDACAADAMKFCSSVTPGEGRLIFCMIAHEDKISTKCSYVLYEASRNMDRALDRIEETADACWADIEKNCADVPEGGGGIAHCLASKRVSLSTQCSGALEKFSVGH